MTERACQTCGASLRTKVGPGPSARYCSGACRQKAYRRRAVPRELTSRDRWVQWKPLRRGGLWTKMPVQPGGRPASSTNPLTWTSHAEARTSKRLGFVLGDGVGAVDLDRALNEHGQPHPWAQAILDRTPATFIEVSPSGDGLHIWGLLPPAPGRVIRDGERAVEVYSAARFMTVTGRRWPGSTSSLADLSGLVATL